MAKTAAQQINSGRQIGGLAARQTSLAGQKVRTVILPGLTNLITKQILSAVAMPNDTNPSYYIFNYVGGGFAIISADRRIEPVLAYSPTSSFNVTGNLPPGLTNWLTVNDKTCR